MTLWLNNVKYMLHGPKSVHFKGYVICVKHNTCRSRSLFVSGNNMVSCLGIVSCINSGEWKIWRQFSEGFCCCSVFFLQLSSLFCGGTVSTCCSVFFAIILTLLWGYRIHTTNGTRSVIFIRGIPSIARFIHVGDLSHSIM